MPMLPVAASRPDRRADGAHDPAASAPAGRRRADLEAMRAVAMLAVVGAHAVIPYASRRLPGLPWCVQDRAGSAGYDALFWGLISWAMPAFFFLSGYAGAAVLARRGRRGFWADRVRRIVVPFAIAVPLVLGPTLLIWAYGWLVSGRAGPFQVLRLTFVDREIRANRYGPAHLWFLEYLLPMLGLLALVGPRRLAATTTAGPRRPWAPLVVGLGLIVLTTLALRTGRAVHGIDPVLDMRNSFLINPLRWLHHAVFFAAGALAFARPREARDAWLARWAAALVVLALAAGGARFMLLAADLDARGLDGQALWAEALAGAVFGWTALAASLGLARRWAERRAPSPLVDWLAAASFWVYVVHFPIVGLIQVDLHHGPAPTWLKAAISFGLTLALTLAAFGLIERRRSRVAVAPAVGGPKRQGMTARSSTPVGPG